MTPNEGEGRALENLVNKTAPSDPVLGLFTNNVTPSNATVLGDLTECTGGGYAAKTLTGANWTITPGTPSSAAYAEQTFSFTGVPGVATIYGYFIKQGTKVVKVERLPSPPFTIASAADVVKVTPQITLGSTVND